MVHANNTADAIDQIIDQATEVSTANARMTGQQLRFKKQKDEQKQKQVDLPLHLIGSPVASVRRERMARAFPVRGSEGAVDGALLRG